MQALSRVQVAQGTVRNVTAENAAQLMQEGWVLLDVRPQSEIEKAGVKGAVEVRAVPTHAHWTAPPPASPAPGVHWRVPPARPRPSQDPNAHMCC